MSYFYLTLQLKTYTSYYIINKLHRYLKNVLFRFDVNKHISYFYTKVEIMNKTI